MPKMPELTQVRIQLAEEGADVEELEENIQKLRNVLLEYDVAQVDFPRDTVPLRAKGTGVIATTGTLLVTLSQSPELLAAIINGIASWLRGHANRSVKLTLRGDTLELTAVSSTEQQRLIEHFLKHHR
jgi:hypothetical protein